MVNLENIKNIFFIGIGGIGMSALARFFKAQGKNVAGYDRSLSGEAKVLEKEGIKVLFSEETEFLPEEFLQDKKALIVYTPAVPESQRQYQYFRKEEYTILKRAEVLGIITRNHYTLAVAGTHGKTTTSGILAHLLKEAGVGVSAFLGGISENYQSNLILAGNEVMVVEADEFDRSFLQLSPNMIAITSMDDDHLDIYGKSEELQDSFQRFAALLPENGKLFYKKGLPLKGISIGVQEEADISAENIRVQNGSYHFDIKREGEIIKDFRFHLPGKHNLFNAVTALAMAIEYGTPTDTLARALDSFKGMRRRFTYHLRENKKVLIEDYAHHPTEISAVHQAIREMHPGKKILAVFQPHLFSRTRDFAEDFARSLDLFDQVMLLDIYPARETPIEGITSEWLLEKMRNPSKKLVQKNELPGDIVKSGAEVVVLMGAGDIGEEVGVVKKVLENEK